MNWYALMVDHYVVREFRGTPPTHRRSFVKLIQQAGCAAWSPAVEVQGEQRDLLPGYVLVQPDLEDDPLPNHQRRWKLIPGVVRVLDGAIGHEEATAFVQLAQHAVSYAFDVRSFVVRDRVQITRGPLAGQRGILIRCPQRKRDRWHLEVLIDGARYAVQVSAEDARRLRQVAKTRAAALA